MRKVLTLKHVHAAETYNVASVDQMNKDVMTMLDAFAGLDEDNMVCIVIRQKALDGTYRVSAMATPDMDVEEILIKDGTIDKLIVQGRE